MGGQALGLDLAHAREHRRRPAEHGEDVAHDIDRAAGELLGAAQRELALLAGRERDLRRDHVDDGRAEDGAAEGDDEAEVLDEEARACS